MEINELIFKRISMACRLLLLVALGVICQIFYLQYIATPEQNADEIAFTDSTVEAIRGDILSHEGHTLATSVPYYKIAIDCTVQNKDTFNKYIDGLSRSLSEFFKDKTAQQYKNLITNGRKKKRQYVALGSRLVDYPELLQIKQFPLFNKGRNKGGISFTEKYKRTNPYGRRAYRTIGFINSQGVGVGIEGSLDSCLRGKPGYQIYQKIVGHEIVPINTNQNIAPQNGLNIRTTLNIDFQEAVENALKEQLAKGNNIAGATAVVMEAKTGAIRAIANLRNDGRGGFDESLNYAIGQATEPGSVLKLATLVALLEDGYITLDSRVNGEQGRWEYLGRTITDSHPVGMQTVKGAFAQSSNICFAKLATQFYANNPQKFVNRINQMRLGENFNLELKGEAASVIHSPTSRIWSPSLLASMGYGYGMLLTPLHTLTFYNAIANDGKMMKPYFIEDYERDGKIVKAFPPTQMGKEAICSKQTAQKAKEALRAVVTEGTGRMMIGSEYKISGKTGTARIAFSGKGYSWNGLRKYQATFCGFFPSDKPAYSMIVVLYSGATEGNFYGASWAGPVFKKIADFIYANSPELTPLLAVKQKEPVSTASSKTIARALNENKNDGFLPNVLNMGLKDALYMLENLGYKVKFSGFGRVIEQDPAPSEAVANSNVITLKLGY